MPARRPTLPRWRWWASRGRHAADRPRPEPVRRLDRHGQVRDAPATCRGAASFRWRSARCRRRSSAEASTCLVRSIGRSSRPCSLVGAWRLATAPPPADDANRSGRPVDCGDRERCGDRPACGPDRHRRRHLPHAAARARRLDRNARRSRPVGLVHPRELDRRAGRPLERRPGPPAGAAALDRGGCWPAGSSVRGSAQPASACSACGGRSRSCSLLAAAKLVFLP